MSKSGFNFKVRGYTKPESDHYVAVCIDLNLVGQGNTPEEAMDKVSDAIRLYFSYLKDHPEEIPLRLPRRAKFGFLMTYWGIRINHYIVHKFIHLKNWFKEYRPFEKRVIPTQYKLA